MEKQIHSFWTLPDADPVKALVPIRRLVWGAFAGALLAGALLVYSALHVMWTTDALSMQEERARAAEIAEILAGLPASDIAGSVAALGEVAGLRNLTLADAAATDPKQQSIPILKGTSGGHFLNWTADRPGQALFNSFAPSRVPVMLALIGGVLACLVVMQGRVRRIESQRILAQRHALRDHLTGLPNRLALEGELARLADERQRFSMLAFDLDRFKPINDLFGHHAGDLALIEVARRLADQLQQGEFLARIGGDEFVAIVRRGGQRSMLAQLARDCIATVSRPLHVVGHNVSVGISIGLVEDGLNHPASALLKQADRALYEAKRLDGAAFCFAGAGKASLAREQISGIPPEPLLAIG
ncbi:GGDEF domain-containing protein [Devosia sp. XJ19-1]|uniref:GGDEF domain-containing protein n=1 Tax=Devosia ureilytica TaxID=2952754 RepID=A0A9Q4FRN4_9HYPH|nr:GGDEF domain-containing protein [Devosia ureilytica]MCP8886402.1 GGDEF domain-containing protein [Devosia ureilytica]